MTNTTVTKVDSVEFFEALGAEMARHADEYRVLGDCNMDLGIEMQRPGGEPFRVVLHFEGLEPAAAVANDLDDAPVADCRLEGALDAWEEMIADIRANGSATGQQTLNSLTLLGDHIRVLGSDTMGVDRFFRYNQTLQAYFDGAAAL